MSTQNSCELKIFSFVCGYILFNRFKPFAMFTDIGTDISAPTSVIAAVIPFSLFTAYQFLSSDRRFDAPENKMRPSPSCVCRRLTPWWWKWSRRAFSLFTAYQILSSGFNFKTALTTAWRRVTIQHLRMKEWCIIRCSRPHGLTMWFNLCLTT